MDGLTFLKILMEKHPLPVVMISSLGQASCQATLEALRLGAVDVLAKPNGPYSVGDLTLTLAQKIRAAAAGARRDLDAAAPAQDMGPGVRAPHPAPSLAGIRVIAIGASTGGPQALAGLLAELPAEMPPILLTQHMPVGFTGPFAERLNRISQLSIKEAQDGDAVLPGQVLLAPGDLHLALTQSSDGLRVRVASGPQVCFSRPSVDVLFSSVAKCVGAKAIGVLLTGMGQDGAQGLLQMRQAGARTIAQDQATAVVFGMPREAIRLGAAEEVLPLGRIAGGIVERLAQPAARFS